MPRDNSSPPPVMTWKRALPVLVVAGIFDILRAMFQMFWFFGPALGAAFCTVAAADTVAKYTGGLGGAGTTALLCSVTTGAIGFAGAAPLAAFGIIMSMALGLIGFLILGAWISLTNRRLFTAQATGAVWFMGSFALSELPFIGSLPAFTITLAKLYRTQIMVEKAAFKKYQEENAARIAAEQQKQAFQAQLQLREAEQVAVTEEQARLAQEERDRRTDLALARYAQQQAANDSLIPENERIAA